MSAHPLGSATLSFGLVSVPIKLFSTGESSAAISFNWLHKKDGARLKQQYVCSKDGDKVEKDEMVKGYEFTKGQYVIFTPEELKALEEKSTNTVEITEFVPADQVDRKYVEKSYFLGPDKGGDRAYRLLAEALKQTGRVAVGQYAARGKQYLIAVRPEAAGLLMEQLRYANEIRSIAEVPIPRGEGRAQAREASRGQGGESGSGRQAESRRCARLSCGNEGIHVPRCRQVAGIDRRAGARLRARRFFDARSRPSRRAAVLLPGPGHPPHRQGARRRADSDAPHPAGTAPAPDRVAPGPLPRRAADRGRGRPYRRERRRVDLEPRVRPDADRLRHLGPRYAGGPDGAARREVRDGEVDLHLVGLG